MSRPQRAQRALPARTLPIRFVRLFAVLLVCGGILAGIARPAAARSEPERIDGNTYYGLDYGWSLTWDEDVWSNPSEVHNEGSEYVVIATDGEPYATGRVDATDWFGGDVNACVDGWDDMLRKGGTMRHIKPVEVEAGIELPDGAAEGAYSLDLKIDDQLVDFVVYVQCRPLGDNANLVLSLGVMPDYYDAALPLFADLVDGLTVDANVPASSDDQADDAEAHERPDLGSVSSDSGDTGDSAPSDAPGDSGVDGSTYIGTNFDWSISWDDRYWQPIAELASTDGGVDKFALASIQPAAPVMVIQIESTAQYDGDLDACAAGGEQWLIDGGEGMTNIAAADVELPDYPSDGTASAYSYTFIDGTEEAGEPVDFISLQVCMPLDSLGATLVVHAINPTLFYDEAIPYLTDLLATIDINYE